MNNKDYKGKVIMDNEKFQELVLQKFEQISRQLGEHTQLLRALEHAREGNKAEIDNLTHSVARIEGEIKELRRGQGELRRGQEKLRQEVGELRQGVDDLRRGQEGLCRGQEELRKGQDRIELTINEIREENRFIREILGDHEVSIRTLRRCSM